jgi:hypothetical protein
MEFIILAIDRMVGNGRNFDPSEIILQNSIYRNRLRSLDRNPFWIEIPNVWIAIKILIAIRPYRIPIGNRIPISNPMFLSYKFPIKY